LVPRPAHLEAESFTSGAKKENSRPFVKNIFKLEAGNYIKIDLKKKTLTKIGQPLFVGVQLFGNAPI